MFSEDTLIAIISLKLNNEKLMIQPLAWAKTFLRFPDCDTFNLLLDTWTILAIAIDE